MSDIANMNEIADAMREVRRTSEMVKCRHCGFAKDEHIEGLWCAKFENTEEVVGEFEDTNQGFRWRLKCGDEMSRWYSDYQGILTHEFNGRLYGLCSAYWAGTLPHEQPFEIVKPS